MHTSYFDLRVSSQCRKHTTTLLLPLVKVLEVSCCGLVVIVCPNENEVFYIWENSNNRIFRRKSTYIFKIRNFAWKLVSFTLLYIQAAEEFGQAVFFKVFLGLIPFVCSTNIFGLSCFHLRCKVEWKTWGPLGWLLRLVAILPFFLHNIYLHKLCGKCYAGWKAIRMRVLLMHRFKQCEWPN